MQDFDNTVAFITGAASGIGFAMARRFAQAGCVIAMADVEKAALDAAAHVLIDEGYRVAPFVVDVTNRETMAHTRDAVLAEFGQINLLFNNAGVNVPGRLDQVSYEDWDWVLGVNLGGVVNGLMTFLPELKKQPGKAHIVNTASVGGLLGMPNLSIYNASKFAVVGISESLREEARENGVGVSVLCPGIVKTNLGTSERNRPGAKNEDSADAGPAPGTDPAELAQQVFDAVCENRFYICTHAEFAPLTDARHEILQSGFSETTGGATANEETVSAMRGIVADLTH